MSSIMSFTCFIARSDLTLEERRVLLVFLFVKKITETYKNNLVFKVYEVKKMPAGRPNKSGRKYLRITGRRLGKPRQKTQSTLGGKKNEGHTYLQKPNERANPHINKILSPFYPQKGHETSKIEITQQIQADIAKILGIDPNLLHELHVYTYRYGGTSNIGRKFVIKVPQQTKLPTGKNEFLEIRKAGVSAGVLETVEHTKIENLLLRHKLIQPLPK